MKVKVSLLQCVQTIKCDWSCRMVYHCKNRRVVYTQVYHLVITECVQSEIQA